jgi:Ca2+-binding RTX toxin-like protein
MSRGHRRRHRSGQIIVEELDARRLFSYAVNFSDTLGETVSIQYSASHGVYFSDGASTYYKFTLSGTTYTRSGTQSTPQYINAAGADMTVNLLGGSDHFWENSSYGGPEYTLSGGNGNDTLEGGVYTDDINGNGGNDVISVSEGDPYPVAGNDGADSITAPVGNNGGIGNQYQSTVALAMTS